MIVLLFTSLPQTGFYDGEGIEVYKILGYKFLYSIVSSLCMIRNTTSSMIATLALVLFTGLASGNFNLTMTLNSSLVAYSSLWATASDAEHTSLESWQLSSDKILPLSLSNSIEVRTVNHRRNATSTNRDL